MSSHVHKPLGPLVENVTEAGTACLLAMVQGNVFALTTAHWLIASRTGLLSGVVATAALWLAGDRRRWIMAAFLTVATVGVDWWSHPSHFAGVVGEAIVTGLAAGALSLVAGWVWGAIKRLRTPAIPSGKPRSVG